MKETKNINEQKMDQLFQLYLAKKKNSRKNKF